MFDHQLVFLFYLSFHMIIMQVMNFEFVCPITIETLLVRQVHQPYHSNASEN